MEDFLNTLGGLYCLLSIAGFIITILIIIAYIKTYNRIKKISETNEKNIELQQEIINQITHQNEIIKEQKLYSFVQFDQWYYDHCYMNNLGPHEWVASGKKTDYDFEFICRRCGQVIRVPKLLFPEHPGALQTHNAVTKTNGIIRQ